VTTRTGAWAAVKSTTEPTEVVATEISFTMPLSKALDGAHVHFVQAGETLEACSGGSVSNPKAAPGNLCVYMGTAPLGLGGKITQNLYLIANPATGANGASKEGALVLVNGEPGLFNGTWAVTDE
jgi:hypothetical protein